MLDISVGGLQIILFAVIAFLILHLSRKFFKGSQFEGHESAKGRVVAVTGSSSGIGLQVVRELNIRGAKVYMLCRDIGRAERAKAKITKLGCDPTRLVVRQVDLTKFSSIRNFATQFANEEDHLDILVNNAGICFYPKYEATTDGYELVWQTNYLGHFLLTSLLLPSLRKSHFSRIINVACDNHKKADSVDFSFVNQKRNYGRYKSCARSKLAMIMHARHLTQHLHTTDHSSGITINSVHPGVCFTNFLRYTLLVKTPLKQILTPFLWFFMRTDKDGAQTVLYAALSRDLHGLSGQYFADCKQAKPSEKALDDEACNVLYNASVEAVGLA
ncbi:hypothetical protein AB6A40_002112 [Gnathostoma spinigerum]|uniref:Retinol dehydrogenase 12 n=1 Tax=Gnathostoma spinigerum TaxID=75299 RepID=A0ABD6EEU6_9BILA